MDPSEDAEPEISTGDDPPGTVIAFWRKGATLPSVSVVVTRPGFARVTVRPVDGAPYQLPGKDEDDAMRLARQIAEGTGTRGMKAAAHAQRRTDGRDE